MIRGKGFEGCFTEEGTSERSGLESAYRAACSMAPSIVTVSFAENLKYPLQHGYYMQSKVFSWSTDMAHFTCA